MAKITSAKNILEAALEPERLYLQKPIMPEAQKVSGLWDTLVSSIAPRNEVTNNRNLVFLPKAIEKMIGDFSYSSLVASEGGLSFKSEKKLLVEQVKNKLLPHIRREFDWDIRLVKSKSMNAAALPGGKIIICEGIIDNMIDYLREHSDEIEAGLSGRSESYQARVLGKELESMLAAVMSHEIAHSDIGHSRSAIQVMLLFYVLLFVGYVLTYYFSSAADQMEKNEEDTPKKDPNLLKVIATFINNRLFNIGFTLYQLARTRGAEYEADAMGMQVYMHEAGYDLNGAVRLMDMFEKSKLSCHSHRGLIETVQEIFSTHPLSSKRKEQAIEIRDRVQQLYPQQRSNWVLF